MTRTPRLRTVRRGLVLAAVVAAAAAVHAAPADAMRWDPNHQSPNVIDCRSGHTCYNSDGSVNWPQTGCQWFGPDFCPIADD